MPTLPPATPSGILAGAALYLSPKDGLPVLRCCDGLQRAVPACLSSRTSWLWVAKNLERVSLAQLLERDGDLCQCLQSTSHSNFSIDYDYRFGAVFVINAEGGSAVQDAKSDETVAPPGSTEEGQEQDPPRRYQRHEIKRGVLEMVEMADLWETLELGSRIVTMPELAARDASSSVVVGCPVAGTEAATLAALGLDGWTYKGIVEQTTNAKGWQSMRFEHPHPHIPLAFFYVKASFDLPGGDGGVDATLGFLSADLEYVLTFRCLQEFPVRRFWCTSSFPSWLDVPSPTADLPNTTALSQHLEWQSSQPEKVRVQGNINGWDVEISSRYVLTGSERFLIDSPNLAAAYADAESMLGTAV